MEGSIRNMHTDEEFELLACVPYMVDNSYMVTLRKEESVSFKNQCDVRHNYRINIPRWYKDLPEFELNGFCRILSCEDVAGCATVVLRFSEENLGLFTNKKVTND